MEGIEPGLYVGTVILSYYRRLFVAQIIRATARATLTAIVIMTLITRRTLNDFSVIYFKTKAPGSGGTEAPRGPSLPSKALIATKKVYSTLFIVEYVKGGSGSYRISESGLGMYGY
jgi:hypothetical protein